MSLFFSESLWSSAKQLAMSDCSNLSLSRNAIQEPGVGAVCLGMQTPFVRNILILLKQPDGSVSEARAKPPNEMEEGFSQRTKTAYP